MARRVLTIVFRTNANGTEVMETAVGFDGKPLQQFSERPPRGIRPRWSDNDETGITCSWQLYSLLAALAYWRTHRQMQMPFDQIQNLRGWTRLKKQDVQEATLRRMRDSLPEGLIFWTATTIRLGSTIDVEWREDGDETRKPVETSSTHRGSAAATDANVESQGDVSRSQLKDPERIRAWLWPLASTEPRRERDRGPSPGAMPSPAPERGSHPATSDAGLDLSDRDAYLKCLLQLVWSYPETGGTRASWAVKESTALRGDLNSASEHPGLGIALFTTELASDVFGARAARKIEGCVAWGRRRIPKTPPHLIIERNIDTVTGAELGEYGDFRHTIACAILMARAGTDDEYRAHFLDLVLAHACRDGGWPSRLAETEPDLPATLYAVEFLAVSISNDADAGPEVADALRQGQAWLIRSAEGWGGWKMNIFKRETWDGLWSTAYTLVRLIRGAPSGSPEWTSALSGAAGALLQQCGVVTYQTSDVQMRVESRVAAGLAAALEANLLSSISRAQALSWLAEWEVRFCEWLRKESVARCDLATATFAASAMLRGCDRSAWGDRILGPRA